MKIPFKTFKLNLLKKQAPRTNVAKMYRMRKTFIGQEKGGADITSEIIKLRTTNDYYKKMPGYEINCGDCGNFARAITRRVGGSVIQTSWYKTGLPGHAWVLWNGKHYDAENPRGVRDWKKLKFFRRLWNEKLPGYGIDRMMD